MSVTCPKCGSSDLRGQRSDNNQWCGNCGFFPIPWAAPQPSDETGTQRTGIFAVQRELSRELLTAAKPDMLAYIKREMRQQLADLVVAATDDGRDYVVRFLGWEEKDLLADLWRAVRYSAAYRVVLRNAEEARPGEAVEKTRRPMDDAK